MARSGGGKVRVAPAFGSRFVGENLLCLTGASGNLQLPGGLVEEIDQVADVFLAGVQIHQVEP